MSQSPRESYNLWSLTVLCLLRVRPMHPYEMQRRIREWHKDEFLDLRRGSLYHAIERLHRQGAIEPLKTTREGRRPERTVYRLTEAGSEKMLEWLEDMLARPVREPTQFFAALSFLPHLFPKNVLVQLEKRATLLQAEIAGLDTVLATMVPRIGRLVLIEIEYARAMRRAELKWVHSFAQELQTGTICWDPEKLRCQFAGPPGEEEKESPIPHQGREGHENGNRRQARGRRAGGRRR
jgi:DNA-binding PadR family transcriptional regulator